jgi:glutaredoxin-like protein
MGLINGKDAAIVRERLSRLPAPVTLSVFASETDCGYCAETSELAGDVADLSGNRVSAQFCDVATDPVLAQRLGIDKTPAIVMQDSGGRDWGIRLFGIPAGFEFITLIETIEMISRGDSGLGALTREKLKAVNAPVHLQVFVTPTCPYCPNAVLLAFRLAMESELITAAMVESAEFPELASHYNVSGVPHTVIGENATPMLGAFPESTGVAMVLAAARARNAG